MIYRPTRRLQAKIKVHDLETIALEEDVWGDWSARLFVVARHQFLLLSHTATLYSVVVPARGATNGEMFAALAGYSIAMFMGIDRLSPVFRKHIEPQLTTTRFAKAYSRSITGSMNDLEYAARVYLESGELLIPEVSQRLNDTPMTAIGTPETHGYARPRDALVGLAEKS